MSTLMGNRDDDLLRDSEDLLTRLYKLIPTQTQDVIAMTIFLVVLPLAFLFQIFFVMADFYEPFSSPWLARVGILSVLFVNCYINYAFMVRVGPNGRNNVLPNTVQAGFRYCHACQSQSPPRAYHCPVCDTCAFRRDHHCSFGAICVGHFNQRYFVAAVTNLWVVYATMVSYTWPWLVARLDHFTFVSYWQLLVPHIAFVFRFISLVQFACIVLMSSTMVSFLFITYLVAAQMICIYRGQSRLEYLMDIHAYDLGVVANIKNSLGRNWLPALFIPFLPLQLPSTTGTHFETREMAKHVDTKSL